jgi:hypothetical protein
MGQVHVKELAVDVQVAPFLQGLPAQLLINVSQR